MLHLNTTSNDHIQNDENWKLMKFLCDQIEENKKKELEQKQPQNNQSPKPIPIIYATKPIRRKKKRNKTFTKNNNRTSTKNKSHNQLLPLNNRFHTKTKSQALYTSALQNNKNYNINPPKRSTALYTSRSYNSYNSQNSRKSQTPRAIASSTSKLLYSQKLEHHKSRSTQLPHQYIRHQQQRIPQEISNTSPSSSGTSTPSQTAIYPSQTVIYNNHSAPSNISLIDTRSSNKFGVNIENNFIETETKNNQNNINNQESPLPDPVQSLVSLVRRVTAKYSAQTMEDDTSFVLIDFI